MFDMTNPSGLETAEDFHARVVAATDDEGLRQSRRSGCDDLVNSGGCGGLMTPVEASSGTPDIRTCHLSIMWDTVTNNSEHLSHDRPCIECGHGQHTYLPCSDACHCVHGRVLVGISR